MELYRDISDPSKVWNTILLNRMSLLTRYILIFGLGAMAFLLTLLLERTTGIYSHAFLLCSIVLISLVSSRLWAFILGSILALGADFFLIAPKGSVLSDWRGLEHLAFFWLVSAVIAQIMYSLKGSYRQLESSRRDAEAIREEAVRASVKADRASTAKSAFLSNMSHEIRTPLNGVIGMTQLMARTELDVEQARFLRNIQTSSHQLLSLLNDILDISKIEAGKIEIENVPFDFKDFVDELYECFSIIAKQAGLEFLCTCNFSGRFFFYGDPNRLKQILNNLLANAIKFTAQGKVGLQIESSIPNMNGMTELQITVTDSGIGMSDSVRSQLFQNFFQGNTSTARSYGGTGLGLAIAKQLIDLMGGTIEVKSTEGLGSEFTVKLFLRSVSYARGPFTEQGFSEFGRELNGSQDRLKLQRKKLWILLAEDNLINQEITKAVLENSGYNIDIANNGLEAVEMVQSNKYAAVLMDCQMPELDGFEATQKMRLMGNMIPIIALTAHAFKEDRERCFAAGMSDYLFKPFSEKRLIAMLDSFALTRVFGESTGNSNLNGKVHSILNLGEGGGLRTGSQDILPLNLEDTPVLDRDFIRRLEEIDKDSGKGLVTRLIGLYYRDAKLSLNKLKESARNGKIEDVRKISHKFKSSNANLGLTRMVKLLEELEERNPDKKNIDLIMRQLEIEMKMGFQELAEIREDIGSKPEEGDVISIKQSKAALGLISKESPRAMEDL